MSLKFDLLPFRSRVVVVCLNGRKNWSLTNSVLEGKRMTTGSFQETETRCRSERLSVCHEAKCGAGLRSGVFFRWSQHRKVDTGKTTYFFLPQVLLPQVVLELVIFQIPDQMVFVGVL